MSMEEQLNQTACFINRIAVDRSYNTIAQYLFYSYSIMLNVLSFDVHSCVSHSIKVLFIPVATMDRSNTVVVENTPLRTTTFEAD